MAEATSTQKVDSPEKSSETIDLTKESLDETYDTVGDLSLPLMQHKTEIPASADPLTAYLNRLSDIEPLAADKQQTLAVRYVEREDQHAGKMLVLTNLRLVVKIAKEYQRRHTNLLDLIQEGNVGLSKAVTRYDPHRGVKFTSYAQYWIRAMILGYLMNHSLPVKVGNTRAGRKLFYNLKKARRALIRKGVEKPSPAQIAEYLEVDEAEVIRVAPQLDGPPVYLDAPAPGYDNTTVGQLMEGEARDPEETFSEYEIKSQIMESVESFESELRDDRERAIWFERMIAEDNKTLVQLGDEYGVSKERIRQVEVQIRKRFKEYLLERLGDDVKVEYLELN